MKATVWIVLIALTLTLGIAAQNNSAGGSQTDPSSAPAAAKPQQAPAEMTHTGCLAAPASEKGNYILKTEAGDVELHGSSAVKADFKAHVGHTVEVSGKKKGAGLEVTKITMKAESCAPAAPAPKS